MRFSYDGELYISPDRVRSFTVHSFYLVHQTSVGFQDRLVVMNDAVAWLAERVPDMEHARPSRFTIHVYDPEVAMEFRLRWC